MRLNFVTEDDSVKGFPKTLLIHNSKGGVVWQVYHINDILEQEIIIEGSRKNGFEYSHIVDYHNTYDETFENWRESEGFKNQYYLRKNINIIDNI